MAERRASAWLGGRQTFPIAREVEIVVAPGGDPPDWVRKSWVGLRLPVIGDVHKMEIHDITTAPRSRFGWFLARLLKRLVPARGYQINAAQAVEILERSKPEAAKWWRENTPHILDGRTNIMFHEWACRPVAPNLPQGANDEGPG